MRNSNTFSICFIVRANKAKDGLIPIYARLTVNSKRVEISLKRYIHPKDWNKEKGIVKGHKATAKEINYYLDEVRHSLLDTHKEMQLKKEVITASSLKRKFLGGSEAEHTLRSIIEYHNEQMQYTLTQRTQENHILAQKYMMMFLKQEMDVNDIPLRQINYKFISEFESFLHKSKLTYKNLSLSNNYIMRTIDRLRNLINLAIRLEWIDRSPFLQYRLKFERVERGFLTKKELGRMEQLEVAPSSLCLSKDIFVFFCYTGFAYVDVMQLTYGNIHFGDNGECWIKTKRQKTNTPVHVPLLPIAKTIIGKYKDKGQSLEDVLLFPRLSNSSINIYLKEVASRCGIKKQVTFHLARHTFATTVTLTIGVPIESVSKMLGHTNISTTQLYARW